MNTKPGGFLDLKNSVNTARWRWRWHQQGGSHFWVARNLTDLRDEDALRRWRYIEYESRRLKRRHRSPVVYIATARFRKMRKQA
jgi:hypothetical protein